MTAAPSLADVRDAAARWVVRLNDRAISDEDLLEFDRWLTCGPEHQRAYDEALDIWLQFDGPAARALGSETRRAVAARRRGAAGRWAALGGLASAALAASIVVLVWPFGAGPAKPDVYATGRGERRAVTLADGTRLELNAMTRVSVEPGGRERRVTLVDGEAAFAVVHNRDRPFVVTTSRGEVRDVGTEFDVRQRGDALSVTVSRGSVDFAKAGGIAPRRVRLTPGQRLDYASGDGAIHIRTIEAADDFAWRTGHLVLRDQSLGAVVDELNLYFDRPIRIASPRLAQLRMSGVLRLDTQEATLHRLTLFAPVKAEARAGEVVLQPAGVAAPSS